MVAFGVFIVRLLGLTLVINLAYTCACLEVANSSKLARIFGDKQQPKHHEVELCFELSNDDSKSGAEMTKRRTSRSCFAAAIDKTDA